MGSIGIGENFRDYLQNRTDLSEAEQDMLAANDFDRWSGRDTQTSESRKLTSADMRHMDSVISNIETSQQADSAQQELDDMKKQNAGNYAEDLEDFQARLNQIMRGLRKGGR